MSSIQRVLFVVLPVVTLCPYALDAQESTGDATRLHAILQSDASLHDKAVACEQLAVVGTKESVPVLAELLTDDRLSHYARFGLEAIPDAAVDEVFRDALQKLAGKQLVGVINSIGQRRDSAAVPQLVDLLTGPDQGAASAAAAALGQIASKPAVDTLLKRLSTEESSELRVAIADACLASAESALANDQPDQAIAIYDAVRKSDAPRHVRVAATYSAIRSGGPAALAILQEQLESDDDALFEVALQAARELSEDSVNRTLLEQLDRQQPHRQVVVITALAERGGEAALPAMRNSVRADSTAVRLAAIRGLEELKDASSAGLLLFLAGDDNDAVAQAARRALAVLPGEEVDEMIVSQLAQASAQRLEFLVQLAGNRRTSAAVPQLREAAQSPSDSVRLAAIKSLGETVDIGELDILVGMTLSARTPEDRDAAGKALTAACARIPDRDGVVKKLAARFSGTPASSQLMLFELLREVGGDEALKTVVAGTRDSSDAVQDAATRVLGEWLTVDVAPELLKLANASTSEKYQVRALRGYIRIIRQFGLPVDERVEMSREALRAANRDDERVLVLQALGRFPAPESLALAVEQLNTRGVKAQAARAAVEIAEKLPESDLASAREAMQRVVDARVGAALAERANAVLEKASR